jgi:hypothetical protein
MINAVAEAAKGEHQDRERQDIGVENPLNLRNVGVETLFDLLLRDVDDGRVEQQHEDRAAEHQENQPGVALG